MAQQTCSIIYVAILILKRLPSSRYHKVLMKTQRYKGRVRVASAASTKSIRCAFPFTPTSQSIYNKAAGREIEHIEGKESYIAVEVAQPFADVLYTVIVGVT